MPCNHKLALRVSCEVHKENEHKLVKGEMGSITTGFPLRSVASGRPFCSGLMGVFRGGSEGIYYLILIRKPIATPTNLPRNLTRRCQLGLHAADVHVCKGRHVYPYISRKIDGCTHPVASVGKIEETH